MTTDIRLDDGPSANWVAVDAPVLKVEGSDFILDSAIRRSGAMSGYRRALVHSEGDTLTVNFNGDYTGGVIIQNARVNIACLHQGGAPELPKSGTLGDLLLTFNRSIMNGIPVGATVTLWLCIGRLDQIAPGGAYWVPISNGEAIEGTA
jgi:hypothetical protein